VYLENFGQLSLIYSSEFTSAFSHVAYTSRCRAFWLALCCKQNWIVRILRNSGHSTLSLSHSFCSTVTPDWAKGQQERKFCNQWLTKLRLNVALDTEYVILETFFPANLLAWYWMLVLKKLIPTQQKRATQELII